MTICDDQAIQDKLCDIALKEEALNIAQNSFEQELKANNLDILRDEVNTKNNELQTLRSELLDLIQQKRDEEESD